MESSDREKNLFKLTRDLIDIPSVTGEEEALARFLGAYLQELNYLVHLQSAGQDRFNIIATTDAPARVVLSTHMDTVPPHIPSSEDAENIYGRGSCDAKGIIAAQIFAAQRLREEGFEEIGLLFTVDEEMGSLGAQVANDHPIAPQCRYLINGEPTDSLLAIGTKGSLRVRITTEGRAAHSAYPEQGESAIEPLLDVLEDIRRCAWPEDELFGQTTCNIGIISGGTRPNIIPAEAHAVMQIRLVTPAQTVKAILERLVEGRGRIEYLSAHDPLRLGTVEGLSQCVVRFATDIPYLSHWGQSLLLGPGSILVAHTGQEQISKRELTEAVELYAKLVRVLAKRQHLLRSAGQ